MNTYKNDKNINIERENIEVNDEKLQIYGPRSKTAPSCTLTADHVLNKKVQSLGLVLDFYGINVMSTHEIR